MPPSSYARTCALLISGPWKRWGSFWTVSVGRAPARRRRNRNVDGDVVGNIDGNVVGNVAETSGEFPGRKATTTENLRNNKNIQNNYTKFNIYIYILKKKIKNKKN